VCVIQRTESCESAAVAGASAAEQCKARRSCFTKLNYIQPEKQAASSCSFACLPACLLACLVNHSKTRKVFVVINVRTEMDGNSKIRVEAVPDDHSTGDS